MQRLKGNKLLRRATCCATVITLGSTAACADMKPATVEKLSSYAGTVLQIAGANYTGPHQILAETLVTMFNGSAVEEDQVLYDTDEPYGNYGGDEYDYGESQDAYNDSDYQTAGYYPAGTPSIDAALIGLAPDGAIALLENGVTLRGPGPGFPGDRIGVAFAPANDAYVYVVAFDSTGWIQSLYPDAAMGHQNPVSAGTEVLIPGEELYGLDNVTGIETIYILASNSPRTDILAQLQPFFGKERPPSADAAYRSVERPIIISRGLTGLRPASVNQAAMTQSTPTSDGPGPIVLNSFLAADGATEMTVTLWFNHQ
jgi:hypothetical protein